MTTRDPRARARALLLECLDELWSACVADRDPSWPWIHYAQWSRGPRHARRIAAREHVRLTTIGRDVYGHREDLDRLAERHAIPIASTDATDETTTTSPARPSLRERLGLEPCAPRRAAGRRR